MISHPCGRRTPVRPRRDLHPQPGVSAMQFFIWAGAILLLGMGGWLFWRWRRRRRIRLIAFVALLREPATFDPTVLAKTAGKAWNVDLGDGQGEGKDGFVVGVGAMN